VGDHAKKKVREFLYVDVERVRSLLAQLDRGVIEAVKERKLISNESGLDARLLGIGGRTAASRASEIEEARSVQDLVFVGFEEVAEEEGVLWDLGEDYKDPGSWSSGWVHDNVSEGQVIRITCDMQLLDAVWFRERLARFDSMAEALVMLQGDELFKGKGHPKQRDRGAIVEAAKRELLGGLDPLTLQAMGDFLVAFMGDAIALRALPCGPSHLEYGFAGALLGRSEYMQEEREHLYSLYGGSFRNWTAVLQVAAIPREAASTELVAPEDVVDAQGLISRARTERMARELLSTMEEIGVVEGPRRPSISVVPLGVYREIP
jgi:hypothetical protein